MFARVENLKPTKAADQYRFSIALYTADGEKLMLAHGFRYDSKDVRILPATTKKGRWYVNASIESIGHSSVRQAIERLLANNLVPDGKIEVCWGKPAPVKERETIE